MKVYKIEEENRIRCDNINENHEFSVKENEAM